MLKRLSRPMMVLALVGILGVTVVRPFAASAASSESPVQLAQITAPAHAAGAPTIGGGQMAPENIVIALPVIMLIAQLMRVSIAYATLVVAVHVSHGHSFNCDWHWSWTPCHHPHGW